MLQVFAFQSLEAETEQRGKKEKMITKEALIKCRIEKFLNRGGKPFIYLF